MASATEGCTGEPGGAGIWYMLDGVGSEPNDCVMFCWPVYKPCCPVDKFCWPVDKFCCPVDKFCCPAVSAC